SRTAPPPSLDRCSRTSSASNVRAASPSADTPDDHLHPWGSAARSGQSNPSTAPPDPSRSGTTLCGSACACRRTRRRRRSFASSGNSGNGIGVFHQIREVFFRPSLAGAEDLYRISKGQKRVNLSNLQKLLPVRLPPCPKLRNRRFPLASQQAELLMESVWHFRLRRLICALAD